MRDPLLVGHLCSKKVALANTVAPWHLQRQRGFHRARLPPRQGCQQAAERRLHSAAAAASATAVQAPIGATAAPESVRPSLLLYTLQESQPISLHEALALPGAACAPGSNAQAECLQRRWRLHNNIARNCTTT